MRRHDGNDERTASDHDGPGTSIEGRAEPVRDSAWEGARRRDDRQHLYSDFRDASFLDDGNGNAGAPAAHDAQNGPRQGDDASELEAVIAHLDLDCFFAQVEQLDHPEWRGKPVIVGGTRNPDGSVGRGVVCTSSYEARACGVRTAMSLKAALQLCPHAICVRGRHARYAELSRAVMRACADFTPAVDVASLDEAYLDISGLRRYAQRSMPRDVNPDDWPFDLGQRLRAQILRDTGLTVSVGIGPNRTIAKIASKACKPDGLLWVPPRNVQAFLDPLPVSAVPGIGPASATRLQSSGIRTLADVRRVGEPWMARLFAEFGTRLSRVVEGQPRARGGVTAHRGRRSISRERTLRADVDDRDRVIAILAQLTARVAWSLRRKNLKAGTVMLKLRFSDFTTTHRDMSLGVTRGGPGFTDHDADLFPIVQRLFAAADQPSRLIRLVGVGVTNLTSTGCRQLAFSDRDSFDRRRQIYDVIDEARHRYGFEAVAQGRQTRLLTPKRHTPPTQPPTAKATASPQLNQDSARGTQDGRMRR